METLYYYIPALESVRNFLELGGNVLLIIGFLILFMWALIVERIIYLRTAHKRNVAEALAMWEGRSERKSWEAHQIREQAISVVSRGLDRHLALIGTCVALCPLLGLLGTVTGMVEVFDVMAVSGSSNPRSMASGVSKATVPTMAGMVAALSGVAVAAWLQGKARTEREILAENMTMDH